MKRISAFLLAICLVMTFVQFNFNVSADTSVKDGYFTYQLYEGEAAIIDVDDSISGDVTIPTTFSGRPVTEIGVEAFYGCDAIESVTIPWSVTRILHRAFHGCTSLEYAYFENVELWGLIGELDPEENDGAVAYFHDIDSDELSDPQTAVAYLTQTAENEYIYRDEYYSYDIYDGEATLYSVHTSVTGEVVIPDTYAGYPVTAIDDYAFAYCEDITSVSIPASVVYIGSNAFEGCISLTDVYFGNTENWRAYVDGEPKAITSDELTDSEIAMEYLTDTYLDAVWENPDTYVYEINDGELTITEVDRLLVGELEIPSTIDGYPVTRIGYQAFGGCTSLESISIPSSVEYIGEGIFGFCDSLETIIIDEENPFYHVSGNCIIETETGVLVAGCNKSVIPTDGSVTAIQMGAFSGCRGIKSIHIPASVEHIDTWVFDECTSLESLTVDENNPVYYSEGNCIIATGRDTVVAGCNNSVIPTDVTQIGHCAFAYCDELTEIVIPNGVTTIGSSSFASCTALESITIPESVTYIGYTAFSGCNNLTQVYFEDTEGWKAGNELLSTEDLADSETAAGYLKDTYRYDEWRKLSDGLTFEIEFGEATLVSVGELVSGNVVIPDTYEGYPVTGIEEYAFYGCETVTGIHIPASVTYIRSGAFSGCISLESLTVDENNDRYYSEENCIISYDTLIAGCKNSIIPDDGSVENIAPYAFSLCTSLESITIPESVTYIGFAAFSGCYGLAHVYFENTEGWRTSDSIISSDDLSDPETAAEVLSNTMSEYEWAIKDDLVFEIYGDEAVLVEVYAGLSGHVDIPSTYDGYPVTEISYGAFYNCSNVTSVTIPESVTDIDSQTFENCENLTEVYFEDTENWYVWNDPISSDDLSDPETAAELLKSEFYSGYWEKCEPLTFEIEDEKAILVDAFGLSGAVTIPSVYKGYPVTKIDAGAFLYCEDITSVSIPASVTSIGNSAFAHCTSLESIIIPDSVKSIGEEAFSGCENLKSVSIGKGVASIGELAFINCRNLETITVNNRNTVYAAKGNCLIEKASKTLIAGCKTSVIPTDGSVVSIGYGAFGACYLLESITIPSTVIEIGEMAFAQCFGLTEINIPASVTSIGDGAFAYCAMVETVSVDDNNPIYHDDGNCIIETDSKTIVAGFKTTVIPDDGSVETIGDYSFGGCSTLESIAIPNTIKHVGTFAFSECYSLAEINIPDSVLTIGENAFSYSPNLKTVTVGDGVSVIEDMAFMSCSSLELVTLGNGVKTIGDGAFAGCDRLESIMLGDTVETIGEEAFISCYALSEVDLGGTVVIGDRAFLQCTALESITIPASAEYIGENAFGMCNVLKNVYFENTEGWSDVFGEILPEELSDPEANAEYLTDSFFYYLARFGMGDIDGVYGKDADDAIYLLYNVFFGDESYPVDQPCDFDGDNSVTANDAIYLLYHVFFGDETYPLN